MRPSGDVGAGRRVKAHVVSDRAALRSLQPQWNGLLGASRANCIFLTWEWIDAWAEVMGGALDVFTVVVHDDQGRLAGLAPLYRTPLSLLGVVRYRALRVMGDHPSGAEYGDWILRSDVEAPAAAAIVAALAGRAADWDCLWMPNVAGWTGARERIVGACTAAGFRCNARGVCFSAIELPDSMDAYVAGLSSNKRRDVRQDTIKVLGRPGVRVAAAATAGEVPRLLEALFELHHRRWKARGQEGTFRRKPAEAAFYARFAPVAFERGWLRLAAIEEHGAPKAVQIGYVYDGTYHSLQEGFDPAYVKGVGGVLRARTIEACIAEGVRRYDFLGEVTEHKRRWLARERTGWDLFVGRRSLKNQAVFAPGLWPTGRYLRPPARE